MMKRVFQFLGFALVTYGLLAWFSPRANYKPKGFSFSNSFDAFYENKLRESKKRKVRLNNEELLIRFAPRTENAFLYVHGFGASRGEGESTMRRLAKSFQANTYMLRLPGHGVSPEAHRDTSYQEYMVEVEEAILRMQQLGNRVYLVGSSMGAAMVTYLSTYYGDKIAGLVLLSPFFDYASTSGRVLSLPGGRHLVELVMGKHRNIDSKGKSATRIDPRWRQFWYVNQYTEALVSLEGVRQLVNQENVFNQVTVPVLLFYYYKDENRQDKAASVAAMKAAFGKFQPTEFNKLIQIKEGNHVLSSEYIETDKTQIIAEIEDFVKRVSTRKLTAQASNVRSQIDRSN